MLLEFRWEFRRYSHLISSLALTKMSVLTSKWAVIVLRAAPPWHQARSAVISHEARDSPAHHFTPLAVAHAARVLRVD